MDIQALLDQAREEYGQVDYQLAAVEGRRQQAEEEYANNHEILLTRKHQLEGKLSALVDVQTLLAQEDQRSIDASDVAPPMTTEEDAHRGHLNGTKQEITADA